MDKRFVLAVRYHEAGLDAEAWPLLQAMLAESAPPVEAVRLAAALRLKTAPAEALDLCERGLAGAAADAALHQVKGEALLALGRAAAAVIALAESIALEPARAETHLALGLACHRAGDLVRAEAACREALRLRPGYAEAWNNLGNLLAESGRPAEAMAAFRAALAANPQLSAAANNLGATLAGQGHFAAAAACYDDALVLAPDNTAAAINRAVARLEQGDAAAAIAALDAVCATEPDNRDAADNRLYARLYIEFDPAVVAAEHRAWGGVQAKAARRRHASAPDRRLRVGYVSADFRRHSVAFFIAPLLRAHDPAAVEVFCYADVTQPDDVTRSLKADAHHWREIHGLDAEAVMEQIEADRIDILVDLAGHTHGNRLDLFARRAAPVQVSALGYPATTGLAEMDYRLCDAVTDPPAADRFATERLVRLAPGLHCYRPPPAPEAGPLPALRRGYVTFGSFNKLAKISPATIEMWAGLLIAVPDARLLLKSKALAEAATCARLAAQFAARGISRGRLDLEGWRADDADHLGRYGDIDIALDTFPYNGTTTTCEALWMGVPVLTLMGEGHAARVSASLLTVLGLSPWIAATPEAFIAQGAAHSADLAALGALRAGLRARMAASTLCDAAGYARAIEAAYREMYSRDN